MSTKIFKAGLVSLLLTSLCVVSCKQRDDYPDFSKKEPPKKVEDVIPPDNKMEPITEKIKNGTAFLKTFLLDSSVNIQAGFDYTHIRFLNSIDQKVSMHIVEIDLSRPGVSMQTLSPYDDYLYVVQPIVGMLQYNQKTAEGKLIVGLVGDAFSGATPTGSYVKAGRVIKTNVSKILPYVGVKKGSQVIEVLNSPNATTFPATEIVPSQYKSLVAGQNWMLYKGYEVIYTTTTTVARTGLGFTQDMKKAYVITVDGVNDFSAGIALNNMREVFKSLGCYHAFFTNGSASNSLAVWNEKKSDWLDKNFPQSGTFGSIANGIAFYQK